MGIKSDKLPNWQVFHNVDFVYNSQDTIQFSFIPQVEEEAMMYISALVPYLKHCYGDWILKHFTSAAVERAKNTRWDETKKQVWSENDEQVNKMIDEDKEFHFQVQVQVAPDSNLQMGGVSSFEQDSDSVSRFHPKRDS
eukprot:CAMPEP_0118720568 /NCGR_PEP_ID=MMETSP0800-20121206/30184_1 /TAXON_ID=210618 ORGANISM="Striatella unipunctata, Strain CCMP2910" /NCGR_SAMPLE_ID=MMETSP0800 /ASSEMBLY_ACC=CAM_ASM_000638 /LENGTH=138 /DNA_ID=CAMNT_0006628225 /DNA_START=822 /DNA_END=1238 /DNA_ORIENTATION=+